MPVRIPGFDLTRIVCAAVGVALVGCASTESPPPTPTVQPVQLTQVIDSDIDDYVVSMLVEERFSGAVLVARGGEAIHARGYGTRAPSFPNDVDTRFHVASITKQFTAAAILQLYEAGQLVLTQSINRYLPARYRAPQWEGITAHHLLTHSSGIPDYAIVRDYYDVVDGFPLGDTVDGMIREAMAAELQFPPGSEFRYSNIGFTLLGEIVEQLSGQSYAEYLRSRVLEPMGMRDSRVHVEDHVRVPNEARGHRYSERQRRHVPDDVVSLPVTAPDGGLITTLADFLAWSRIYAGADQPILQPASIELLTGRHIAADRDEGPLSWYGYGLSTGERLIGHAGYIVGFRSQFMYDRLTDTLVVVFANNVTSNPQRIASDLLTLALTED